MPVPVFMFSVSKQQIFLLFQEMFNLDLVSM